MSAPGLTSPIRKETFENLQLNAGIFIKNLDYTTPTDSDALKTAIAAIIQDGTNILGATRGGGSFTATREIRTPEVDGKRYNFKGGDFVDSVEAYLSTTLIEVTPETVAACLGATTVTTSGRKTTIQMRTAFESADYVSNICWVGDLADGQLVVIALKNAINTSDFSLTFADKNEGTIPVEFHARQAQVSDYDVAPFEIIFLRNVDLTQITVTSAAGSTTGATSITVNVAATGGQKYLYKIGVTSPTVAYHEIPDYSWSEWDGTSQIKFTTDDNGKRITILIVGASGIALSKGSTTLVVKTS